MIETLRTREGYVKAFCDYRIVDALGNNKKNGDRLYVRELWIHPRHRGRKQMNKIFNKIHSKFQTIEYVYWLRDKYNDRMCLKPIDKIIRRAS